MKLAEALLLRGDMQKKLASLRERITQNAVVQEGETPHEDPEGLLQEAFEVLGRFERLVFTINQANLASRLSDGRTLTEAMAARDALVQKHSILEAAISGTRQEPMRYSVREIKWVATLSVPRLQEQVEDVARQIRELNARIQEKNWQVEVEGEA